MPFQSWEIRPHSLNSAILTVIAAIIEIEIEIKVIQKKELEIKVKFNSKFMPVVAQTDMSNSWLYMCIGHDELLKKKREIGNKG